MRIALLLILVGCASQYHVKLDAPSPTITPEERVALFWKMRPTKEGTETFNGSLVNDTIMLGDNKTEVVSPEDLEPLVGSDSETMRYARESIPARRKSNFLYYMSLSMAATALAAFTFGSDAVAIAGGGLFVVSLVPYFMQRHYARKEIQLRRKAFAAYPADLGRRLNLCAHENEVVPCEAPLPEEKRVPATNVPSRTGSLRMRVDDLVGVR